MNTFLPLRPAFHELTVEGDLRSRFTPWGNPLFYNTNPVAFSPSGSGTYQLNYIKFDVDRTPFTVDMLLINQNAVPVTAAFQTAIIVQDADIYNSVMATNILGDPAPTWVNCPIGSGSNGTVTVNAGGQIRETFTVSVHNPQVTPTLVLSAHLTGGGLRVETISTSNADDY
jgi:hypothetical protein